MILVALAGAVGAVARYIFDRGLSYVLKRPGWAVACINIVGSFTIGLAAYLAHTPEHAIFTTGFMGGFTTFSTAMADVTFRFANRRPVAAVGMAVGVFAMCIVACFAGRALAFSMM